MRSQDDFGWAGMPYATAARWRHDMGFGNGSVPQRFLTSDSEQRASFVFGTYRCEA